MRTPTKVLTYACSLVVPSPPFHSPHVWISLSKVSDLVVFGASTLPGVRVEVPRVSDDRWARYRGTKRANGFHLTGLLI